MTIDSNPQNNQSQNETPLWVERLKTTVCVALLSVVEIFTEYAAVNYGNFSGVLPARGERTELVRLTEEKAR
jgi:hypothetical protein